MTEERYKQIDEMSAEELDALSPEEYEEYEFTRLVKGKYLAITSQKDALDELMCDINTAQQGMLPVWKTGFTALDEKLDGGFLGGNLILLGAISSLGKTTFALQIAENIASAGQDVIVFSLEMSKKELNAKSISRNSYRLSEREYMDKTHVYYDEAWRLTMGDVLRGRVGLLGEDKRRLFDAAYAETDKLSDRLYIIRDNSISVEKVEKYIKVHEAVTGHKPFAVLDYLQILKHDETLRGDKRLLTDDDVNNLKDLAVRVNVPIMVISSFNRNNYYEPVSMGSFKESGGIEYSGDTLIGMQYSGMQYQKHYFKKKNQKKAKLVYEAQQDHINRVRQLVEKMDENGANGLFLPIDVVLLKNRGVSKGKILFEFCPKYNIFRELEDQSKTAREKYDINRDANEIESDDDGSSVVSDDNKSLGAL